MVVAIFAGCLIHFLMSPHEIHQGYKFFAIGMAGLSERTFKYFEDKVFKKINTES